jgi:hypothetical protein
MLNVTHVHMSAPATGHEHIQQVWVVDTSTSTGKWWTVDEAVRYLKGGGKLYVVQGRQVEVRERQSPSGRWYIQTVADGLWQNNLLELPRM